MTETKLLSLKYYLKEASQQPEPWSKRLVFSYRFGYWLYRKRLPKFLKIPLKLYYKFLEHYIVRGRLNCNIHPMTEIGYGMKIYHPFGIIINSGAIIGKNAIFRHNVTIGNDLFNENSVPVIGENVNLGAGSTIIGHIIIGNDVVVGASAVVTKSFGDGAVLVGIPAKNINKKAKY